MVQEAYIRAFRGLSRFRGDVSSRRGCTGSPPTARTPTSASAASTGTRGLYDGNPMADDRPSRAPSARRTPAGLRDESRTLWRRFRPQARARWSCCATSTTCPMRPSQPSSGSPRRRPRCVSTGRARSCGRTCSPAVWRRPRMRCEDAPRGSGGRGRRLGARSGAASAATSSGACGARPSSCSTAGCCGRCGPCAPRCSSRRPACWPTCWPTSRRLASGGPSGR